MEAKHIFRVGKIHKKNGGLLGAIRHNKRLLPKENQVDSAKSSLNYSLWGNESAELIDRLARKAMIDVGIDRPRKNSVLAVEVIFSLPVSWNNKDTRSYFEGCLKWVQHRMGGQLLTFDVHLDESAPHAHALILPLIDGRMQGSKLVGGTGNLIRLANLFFEEVAIHYGLSYSRAQKLSVSDRLELEGIILRSLENDPIHQSAILPAVKESIHRDPKPYAEVLSIKLPSKTKLPRLRKHFVDYLRAHGRGSFIK